MTTPCSRTSSTPGTAPRSGGWSGWDSRLSHRSPWVQKVLPSDDSACGPTISLCPTCYREIPAERVVDDQNRLWMEKECPEHGRFRALMEKDADFWVDCQRERGGPDNYIHRIYNQVSLIEATDRCNVNCAHCYHQPENASTDRPAQWIISKALSMPTLAVTLMGAEPTVRKDLHEICAAIRSAGKMPIIYTNGVKGANVDYMRRLRDNGLAAVNVSVHNTHYHGESIHDRALACVRNTQALNMQVGQVSHTVTNLEDDLLEALDTIIALHDEGIKPINYCVRTPAAIGRTDGDNGIFASEIYRRLREIGEQRGYRVRIARNYGNNPYHVGVSFGPVRVMCIHWPTVENIDIGHMNMGPWASFIDGTIGSFALQAILRDGLKKGWWQGKRIDEEVRLPKVVGISYAGE